MLPLQRAGSRLRPIRLAVLLLFAAAAAAVGTAPAADVSTRGERERLADEVIPPGSPAAQELDRLLDEERQRHAEARARRATPGERAEREASRGRYRDLSASQASDLARSAFGRAVIDEPFRPMKGRADVEVVSSHAAAFRTPAGEPRLLVATYPLAVGGDDDRRPLDLDLDEATRAAWAPRAPATPVRIAREAAEGVEVGERGLHIRPVGVSGSEGAVVDGTVFYANVARDTDFAVRPAPTGIKTFHVLRSPESPERFELRVEGADEVRPRGDGALLQRDGETIAAVGRVVAVDADGVPVAAELRVDGTALTIDVPHRGEDVRYPIAVDPPIDTYDWECTNGCSATYAGWTFYDDLPAGRFNPATGPLAGSHGPGLYINGPSTPQVFSGEDRGLWVYDPQGDSEVDELQLQKIDQIARAANQLCVFGGVLSAPAVGQDDPLGAYWDKPPYTNCAASVLNASYSTSVAGDRPDNMVGFGVEAMAGGSYEDFVDHLGYASITLADTTAPTFEIPGWQKATAAHVKALDSGVGIKEATLTNAPPYASPCEGTRDGGLCPASVDVVGAFADGATTVSMWAKDAAGNTRSATGTVKVDTAAPVYSVAGPLWDRRGDTVTGTASLTVTATDPPKTGSPAGTLTSGVASIDMVVDGKLDKTLPGVQGNWWADQCSTCERRLSVEFDAMDAPSGGKHTIEIVVKDHAGNEAARTTFDVVAAPEHPVVAALAHTGLESGWINDAARPTVTLYGSNRQPGIKRLGLERVDGTWSGANRDQACTRVPPGTGCERQRKETLSYNELTDRLPDGRYELRGVAKDAAAVAPKAGDGARPRGLEARFYDDTTFGGRPVYRQVSRVRFNWGQAAPAAQIHPDSWSARYSGYVTAPTTGTYEFVTVHDDRVRVTVNGTVVIDDQTVHPTYVYRGAPINLTAGVPVPILVEYSEEGVYARVELMWRKPGATEDEGVPATAFSRPTTGWRVETYTGTGVIGSPTAGGVAHDDSVDETYASDGPVFGMSADNWSSRWSTRLKPAATGDYKFRTTYNDAAQLWVAGRPLLDDWLATRSTDAIHTSAPIRLEAGRQYDARLHVADRSGASRIKLEWQRDNGAWEVIPAAKTVHPTDGKTAPWSVGVDNVKPTVDLSGGATQPINPGNDLQIAAVDPPPANGATQSGISKIEVRVDGVNDPPSPYDRSSSCPTTGCAATWDQPHTINASEFDEGPHTIEVKVFDLAGNSATETQNVFVTRLDEIDRSKLGLEQYFHYHSTRTGADTQLHVNAHTGNVVWHSLPVVNPGRGLSSVVNLTYNSHDRGGILAQQLDAAGAPLVGASLSDLVGLAYGEAGHGFSIGISGLTRLNEPLAGAAAAMTTGRIVMTDPDGTAHTFSDPNHDGIFDEPPGVNLRLRRYDDRTGNNPATGRPYEWKRWAITRADGVTAFFDPQGYATTIEDRNGNVILFEYQTYSKIDGSACPVNPAPTLVCAKRVINVVDDAGVDDPAKKAVRSVQVEYWPGGVLTLPTGTATVPPELSLVGGRAGRIKTIVDHAKRLTKFDYDTQGYLTRLREGAVRTSATSEDTTHEREFVLTYEGEASNRVLDSVRDPNARTTSVDYEDLSMSAAKSVGREVTDVYDRRNSRFRYDLVPRTDVPGGVLMTVTDPERGNLLSRTDADGRPRILTDGRQTETRLDFDADNNVERFTQAAGTADQAITTSDYNGHGQLESQLDAEGRLATFQYRGSRGTHIAPTGLDAQGAWVSDLERITPPEGNWTHFTLDPSNNGNVLSSQVRDQPAATTGYGAHGLIERETDEAGNVTTYRDFDDNGLPQTEFDERNQRWTYTYDAVGNVSTRTDPRGSNTADPDDFRTELFYDSFNRVIRKVTPKRSVVNDYVTRRMTYDKNGNQLTFVDGNGHTRTLAYTVMDELRREEAPPTPHHGEGGPAAEVTTIEYDAVGRASRRTAPNGDGGSTGDYETTFTYDRADNLVVERRLARTRPPGTPAEVVTSTHYDRRNNVIGVADPNRNALGGDPIANAANVATRRWTYTYDRTDNRRTAVEDPGALALTTEFTYDGNENLETEISPRGFAENRVADFTTTYGYDTNDLVTSIRIGNRETRYERRGDGRIRAKVAARGVATADPGDFRTTYDYFPTGELQRWTLPRAQGQYGPAGRGVTYERNEVGDPIRITDPRDRVFANEFFDTGELLMTQRPSWWKLRSARSDDDGPAADLDPALDRSERPLVERTYAEWLRGEDTGRLPDSEGHGDFGAVDPQGMPSIVPRAGATTFAYDDEMRLTEVQDAGGRQSRLVRDAVGRVVEERRPLAPNVPDLVTAYSFDRNGNLRQVTDPEGQLWTTEYDEYDRPIVAGAPGAASQAPDADQPGTVIRRRTETRYDANGKVVEVITPRGTRMLRGYDAVDRLISDTDGAGGVTRYGYDGNGNRTLERRPLGNSTNPPDDAFATTRAYNQFDEVERETDGLGNQTTFGYDVNGNQTRVTAPGAATEPGSVPVPHVTEREFDGRDLPWTERTGTADGSRRVTVTEFDPNGNLRRVVKSHGVDDATRRPANGDVPTQDGPPSLAATLEATVYEHSNDGLVTAEWLPRGVRDVADGVQWQRTFTRDPRGRVTAIEAPFEAGTDRHWTRTTYTHFDTGWIRTATDWWYPKGGGPPNERQTSTYEYDRAGRQTAWLSTTGREMRRAYYPNGQLRQRRAVSPVDPARTYTYGYNANDSMTQTRDFAPPGRMRVMEYDGAERQEVVDEQWAGGRDTAMRYDLNGNLRERWTDGVYNGRNPDGTVNVTGAKRTTFTYDVLDREATMVVAPPDRPNRTTATTYWPSGDVRTRTKQNGTVEDWHYDDDGRVNQMRRHRGPDPPNVFQKVQPYHYDENGNRDIDERGLHVFNSRDQLTAWTPRWGDPMRRYELNGAGSVLRETVGNRVTTNDIEGDRLELSVTDDGVGDPDTTDYGYDAFGNLEYIDEGADGGDAEFEYDYDAFGRMTRAERRAEAPEDSVVQQFAYDGLDRRDFWCRNPTGANCEGGQRYDMAYVGTTNRVSHERAPGGLTRTYDYDSRLDVQGQDADAEDEPMTYRAYTKDANGSVEGMEDPVSGVTGLNEYEYDPYGELRNEPAGDAAQNNPIRFEGFYYDAGVKTYDMHARAYRPDIARFLSEDRFEASAGDFHLQSDVLTGDRYVFAGGNPVNNIEWDGHDTTSYREVSTKRYRDDAYDREYKGKKPLKIRFKIPDLQGRRSGRLRIALFISECRPLKAGLGDCRGFDRHFDSLRTRVTIVIDFRSDILTLLINPSCARVGGVKICRKPNRPVINGEPTDDPHNGRVNVWTRSSGTGVRGDLGILFSLKNSMAPTRANPAIDGSIILTGFRDRKGRRRMRVRWANDAYPSLEAYYQPHGKRNRVICRHPEESIDDLFGAAEPRCEGVI